MSSTAHARQYAICRNCGKVVYRYPGFLHGDGQLDTDDNPVWLLSTFSDLPHREPDKLPRVSCGCIDH